MKCPKCGYTSFDYLATCKKCDTDLSGASMLLQVIAISPDDRAAVAPSGSPSGNDLAQQFEESGGAIAGPEEATALPYVDEGGGTDFSSLSGDEDASSFDQSFDELMQSTTLGEDAATEGSETDIAIESTSLATDESEAPAGSDDEEFLDIDFGDAFGDDSK